MAKGHNQHSEAFGQKRALRIAEFASRNQSGRAQALRLRIKRVTTGRLAPYRCNLCCRMAIFDTPCRIPNSTTESALAAGSRSLSKSQCSLVMVRSKHWWRRLPADLSSQGDQCGRVLRWRVFTCRRSTGGRNGLRFELPNGVVILSSIANAMTSCD